MEDGWISLASYLVGAVILIYPLWRIFSRAGFKPALAFIIFLPYLGSLVVVLVLAFARWPLGRTPRSTAERSASNPEAGS